MAVPKKKLSDSKRRIKRSGDKITEISVNRCKECGRVVLQHFECKSCFKK
jgi:ribosomal protein L32